MGIWSFVKGAGKSIFGAAEASEAPHADALKAELAELGLDATGVEIEVDGDTVKLSGAAVSQEIKEKIITAVGNVEGIASVADDVAGGDPKFHTVEKGDNLWKISEKALGNGSRYTEIFEANKPMLKDPDLIYPGQVLRIPQD